MELLYKLGSAAFLTVIVLANLWERKNPRTSLSRLLWARHGLLMYTGLGFLAMLVAFSLIEVATILEWAPPAALDSAMPVLGPALAGLALAVIALTGRALLQAWRERKPR
jgi:hypothetical protein